jgi:hypothetical protein
MRKRGAKGIDPIIERTFGWLSALGFHAEVDPDMTAAIAAPPRMTEADVEKPNWDALTDSLVGGLGGLDSERIAIVWPASRALWDADRITYDAARGVRTSLVFRFAARRFPEDVVKRVLVVYA